MTENGRAARFSSQDAPCTSSGFGQSPGGTEQPLSYNNLESRSHTAGGVQL